MSADACRALPGSIEQFAREYWFARRLLRYGIDITSGITTAEERPARARRGILERGLAGQRVVINKPETWGELFERLYGVPLSDQTPSLSPTPAQEVLL